VKQKPAGEIESPNRTLTGERPIPGDRFARPERGCFHHHAGPSHRRFNMRRRICEILTLGFALVAASTALQAQTFDIVELNVLSNKEINNSFSGGEFINQFGHVLGRRTATSTENRTIFRAFFSDGSRVVDFGAPDSQTNPHGLNDLDHVIGTDDSLPGLGFFWDEQTTIPLGFFPTDLNNLDQVLGMQDFTTPVLWSPQEGLRTLETPVGAVSATVGYLNERGHVAGRFLTDDTFENRGFFWSEETGAVDIGPGRVMGMNDLDQMIVDTNPGLPYRVDVTIDENGTLSLDQIDLKTPLDSSGLPRLAFPMDINNAGQAVGSSFLRPIFWDTDGSFILSPELSAGGSVVLNDSGHVVHSRSNFAIGVIEGFYWRATEDVFVTLPSLGGNRTQPYALNELDQITGFSTGPEGQRAVLWQPTGPIPVGSEDILAIQQYLRELLVDGRIFEGDFASLMAKLTAADSQLRAGNGAAAKGVLKSAQNQIEQLVFNGFISPTVGLELIAAIDEILLQM
jgi:hypothetical protein